jgi:hypothetical protein
MIHPTAPIDVTLVLVKCINGMGTSIPQQVGLIMALDGVPLIIRPHAILD